MALSVTGQLLNLLLRDEGGKHVFRKKGVRNRNCRVDVVDGGEVDDFRPVASLGRRAATKHLKTRRVYDFSEQCVVDAALGKRFSFDRIDEAMSAAVDRRLFDLIDSELGEW